MEGPEWAAGKLSEDHKDNRWGLLSADLREIEQRLDHLEQQILAWAGEDVDGDFAARIAYLETWMKEIHDAYVELAHPEGRVALLEKSLEQMYQENRGNGP